MKRAELWPKAERALRDQVKQRHALTKNALWMEMYQIFRHEKSYAYDWHIPILHGFLWTDALENIFFHVTSSVRNSL